MIWQMFDIYCPIIIYENKHVDNTTAKDMPATFGRSGKQFDWKMSQISNGFSLVLHKMQYISMNIYTASKRNVCISVICLRMVKLHSTPLHLRTPHTVSPKSKHYVREDPKLYCGTTIRFPALHLTFSPARSLVQRTRASESCLRMCGGGGFEDDV